MTCVNTQTIIEADLINILYVNFDDELGCIHESCCAAKLCLVAPGVHFKACQNTGF